MSEKPNEPMGTQPAQNTDREIWRERADDYYTDSIHVTQGGGIGLDCGGLVIVKPIREWHALAKVDLPKPLPTPVDAPPQDVQALEDFMADEIAGGMVKAAKLLCETRGHEGRRPCEFCTMQISACFLYSAAAERPAPAQADLDWAKDALAECSGRLIEDAERHLASAVATVRRAAQAERVSAEELAKLVVSWRERAKRLDSGFYDACADELEAALRPTHTPESGEKTNV